MGTAPYAHYSPEDLDRQYNARATVDDLAPILARYAEESRVARDTLTCHTGVAYGPHPDETLDIFPATQPGSPVLIFVHGGYWRALSKDESSFMAPAFVEAGATVVAVNYSLAPGASLDEIVRQCRAALAWVAHEIHRYHGDPARIHIAGSSAGGHLVGMLLADGWHADFGIAPDTVKSATPVSGLFDLEPLINTHVNAWMHLDAESAARLSPLQHLPTQGCPLIVSYGETETAEFARQSRQYLDAWHHRGFAGQYIDMPGTNHFDVILHLADPASPLTLAVFAAMGIGPASAPSAERPT